MIVKNCKKHGELTIEKVYLSKYKNKIQKKCKQCEADRAHKYYEKNKEAEMLRDKNYYLKNKEKIRARKSTPEKLAKRREWAKNNAERYADYYREKQKKYKEELADPYIKKIIQNGNKAIRMKDIPDNLIELARTNLLVKKKINEHRILQKLGKKYGKNSELRTIKKSLIDETGTNGKR